MTKMSDTRAALYLRVSTARQAEHDVSIPDQLRQGEAYCAARHYEVAEVFIERGASATNDRRPEFQRMIDAATNGRASFDVIVVHSFSRFFRDHFELEFYVRKLRKNGVKLLSITQEMGDDPMHEMMRQIMALFDEYQSKENAKHVIRAFKENARQGFWNGSHPPIGYRAVAAERRGVKIKKRLEIDPQHARTINLIFYLALHGDGQSGPMGVKKIASCLNERGIETRTGGPWGIGQVHRILTRRTYIGEHAFNQRCKSGQRKPASEIVIVDVPPIVDRATFDAVQAMLRMRRVEAYPSHLPKQTGVLLGLIYCDLCGGAMSLRTGKSGRYRYYTCSTRARQGTTGCDGMTVRMDELDELITSFVAGTVLEPDGICSLLQDILEQRCELAARQVRRTSRLTKEAQDAELRLERLYHAIEEGMVEPNDASLRGRIEVLTRAREAGQQAADEARARSGQGKAYSLTSDAIRQAANNAGLRLRFDTDYRRDLFSRFVTRIEVAQESVQLIASRSRLFDLLIDGSQTRPGSAGGTFTISQASDERKLTWLVPRAGVCRTRK